MVSAYDSGTFHAGPITVFFKNSAGAMDSVVSNQVPIEVEHPLRLILPSAFLNPLKDRLEYAYSWKEFIPYISLVRSVLIYSLLLLVLFYGGSIGKLRRQHLRDQMLSKDPAHIWARKELKNLEDENLWQKDQVKLYYSRLTDILRLYLEFRYKWLALESTTEEIEADMEKYNLKEKAKGYLLQILRNADLVKFAKMLPAPDANIASMESAYKFIDFTEPKEDDDKNKK